MFSEREELKIHVFLYLLKKFLGKESSVTVFVSMSVQLLLFHRHLIKAFQRTSSFTNAIV
jgi:hypothetical protein